MKKQIKIVISINENNVGFTIERPAGDAMSLDETFKFIGALETLKRNQLKKIDSKFQKIIEKDDGR